MKKYRPIYSLLLLLVLMASCQEQNKTDLPEERTLPAADSLSSVDSYFVESQAITSSFGPGNITRNVLQDRKGHMWLATWEGIIRYDGISFTNFTNKETSGSAPEAGQAGTMENPSAISPRMMA